MGPHIKEARRMIESGRTFESEHYMPGTFPRRIIQKRAGAQTDSARRLLLPN